MIANLSAIPKCLLSLHPSEQRLGHGWADRGAAAVGVALRTFLEYPNIRADVIRDRSTCERAIERLRTRQKRRIYDRVGASLLLGCCGILHTLIIS